jgi:hypothetical protein
MTNKCTKQTKDKLLQKFLNYCELLKLREDFTIEKDNITKTYLFGDFIIVEKIGRFTKYIELKSSSTIGQVNFSLDNITYDINEIMLSKFMENNI